MEKVETKQPIILITHIPLTPRFNQYAKGMTDPTPDALIVANGKEVGDVFHFVQCPGSLAGA